MKNLNDRIFIDVFLSLFLILCLRKLRALDAIPASMELLYIVIASFFIEHG